MKNEHFVIEYQSIASGNIVRLPYRWPSESEAKAEVQKRFPWKFSQGRAWVKPMGETHTPDIEATE